MSARICRVCGCTDGDCGGCVERTGLPCWWVETTLCSACTGPALIGQERRRQIEREGYTSAHDDEHGAGQLAMAAVCYALPDFIREAAPNNLKFSYFARFWPFESGWWKPTPTDRTRELVKAGALIAAEIDRINRLPKGEQT